MEFKELKLYCSVGTDSNCLIRGFEKTKLLHCSLGFNVVHAFVPTQTKDPKTIKRFETNLQ